MPLSLHCPYTLISELLSALSLLFLHHYFASKGSQRVGFQVTLPCSKLAPGALPLEAGIQAVNLTVTEARGRKGLQRTGAGRESNHELRRASYLFSTVYTQTLLRDQPTLEPRRPSAVALGLFAGRDRVYQQETG